MRRSLAPSFQSKKNIPANTPLKEVPVETQNSARSTSSILDLLNVSDLISDSNADFTESLKSDNQKLNINPSRSTRDDDIDGNFPDATVGNDDGIISESNENCVGKRVYNVVWGKLSKKKHKSWEGDGVLEISSDSLVLKDCDGKCLGTKRGVKTNILEEGSRLVIGSKEIELIDLVIGETKRKVETKENPTLQPSRVSTSICRPHKRPRFSVFKSENGSHDSVQKTLVMPTPSSEHQRTTQLALAEDDIDNLLSI